MRAFISAGHWPPKPGVCHEGFCEYDEAIKWVEIIKDELQDLAVVVETGTVTNKANFVNSRCTPKDVFLEIHFNSAEMAYHRKIEGAETLYYPGSDRGKILAERIQDAMLLADPDGLKDRGTKEGWYQQNKDKGSIYILRKTKCTALIIEPEFIQQRAAIEAMRRPVSLQVAKCLREILGEHHD